MNINEAFPSKYLKSADLQGRVAKLKIASIGYNQIGNDTKMVMHFQGKDKGMVLNVTNARTIADQFGDETDNWIGAEIEVFSMKVDMQGRMVDGLRVRVLAQRPAQRQPAPARPPAVPNARQVQESNPPAPAMAMAEDDPFDDEIPF